MLDKSAPSGPEIPHPTAQGDLSKDELQNLFDLAQTPPGQRAGRAPLQTAEELEHTFRHLQITGLLGRGGMGVVYKARNRETGRNVALKLLPTQWLHDAEFCARFSREAEALGKLSHPHIVGIHESGWTEDGQPYMVMEFIDGVNLAELVLAGGLAPAMALKVAEQVCDALGYAHGQGLVHRDIKPANIIIDRSGTAKVADFGLAGIAQEPGSSRLTATGAAFGTADYMSPEQRKGLPLNQQSDIYSFGVLLYEMLCGDLPQGMFAPPSRRSGCDERVDAIVARALQPDAKDRYASMAEVKAALQALGTRNRPPYWLHVWTLGIFTAALGTAALLTATLFQKSPPRLRHKAPAPVAPVAAAPGAAWQDVLKEVRSYGALDAKLQVVDTGAALLPKGNYRWRLPVPPMRNGTLRLKWKLRNQVRWSIGLRASGEESGAFATAYTATFELDKVLIHVRDYSKQESRMLGEWPYPPGFDTTAPHMCEFRAVEDELSLSIDGAEMGKLRDSFITEPGYPIVYLRSGVAVTAVQTQSLDPVPAPTK